MRVLSLKQWGHCGVGVVVVVRVVVGVYMGMGNLYLGDPWINSPFHNLDKVLLILSRS